MTTILLSGLLMGLGATIAMDLWALALNRVFGVGLSNWGNVGRWVVHLGRGTMFHDNISNAAPVHNETTIGWLFHYAVGLAYGVVLAVIMGADWLASPTFLPAWIFAIVTIGAGWFILQPGLGVGIAASKTATPWKARGMGLLAHTAFGFGLWITAVILA
ncbi:DUF2938 domain-containing protein [Pacificibacter marinus]|uniref:DUF2938 domain-containing protein n=1 Tax=Pacificibacter marinus TaxID=658057 RepID=A0A1Y5SGI5_9RHOB|nr:DUF2938 domain-containing protein [Pacificibacter marinus]SEK52639.1 Protein of unknown function [Pacificibacter marinus]SLN38553.1 hypothetical protein PAM7971_01727 [Pacificibacter marinus]